MVSVNRINTYKKVIFVFQLYYIYDNDNINSVIIFFSTISRSRKECNINSLCFTSYSSHQLRTNKNYLFMYMEDDMHYVGFS